MLFRVTRMPRCFIHFLSPTGHRVSTSSDNGAVCIWDIRYLKGPVFAFQSRHPMRVIEAAWLADDELLTLSYDRQLHSYVMPSDEA